MINPVSNKIDNIVEIYKKKAEKALDDFDYEKERFDSDIAKAAETASWKSHSIRRKIMDSYKMPEPSRKPASIAAL